MNDKDILNSNSNKAGQGKVYLVGAGPGHPRLLTLRAVECIRTAQVLVYDRLISPRIEQMAPVEAQRIFVGKAAHRHTVSQAEISKRLVELALAGYQVVRLKGGDPFIFGRGGEEAAQLAAAGIAFEIVPGVTSAYSAPAYAGIPLTHREYASSFAVVTGHAAAEKGRSRLDYTSYAQAADTLVFLMGVENLAAITTDLQAGGLSGSKPAALIQWGTRADQKTVTGTLADINAQARQQLIKPPAVLVVGEVVSLRDTLSWREKLPLFGKRVVITRPATQASTLAAMIEDLGGEAWEFPAIQINPPADWQPFDRCLANLTNYKWLVFTSINGVNCFFQRLAELQQDIRQLAGLKLAAIGPGTARVITVRGLQVDFMPEEFRAEEVAAGLLSRLEPGDRVLLPRAAEARAILPQQLRQSGWAVDEVPVYQTVTGDGDEQRLLKLLQEDRVDAITFTSSSTVQKTLEKIGAEGIQLLQQITLASIGPITSDTLHQKGLTPQVEAPQYTVAGLVAALTRHFQEL